MEVILHANKNSRQTVNLKEYISESALSDKLQRRIFDTDFRAYKALHPDDVVFQKRTDIPYIVCSYRIYLKRTALDDFAAWQEKRDQWRRESLLNGHKKRSVAAQQKKIAQQQLEMARRITHRQDIEFRHATGQILSVKDLKKIFPDTINIEELFCEYIQEADCVIDGCYIPADKLSDFAFVMDLDDKKSPFMPVAAPCVQDIYTISDSQMDRIATRLSATCCMSELAAAQELLNQIASEQKHRPNR